MRLIASVLGSSPALLVVSAETGMYSGLGARERGEGANKYTDLGTTRM